MIHWNRSGNMRCRVRLPKGSTSAKLTLIASCSAGVSRVSYPSGRAAVALKRLHRPVKLAMMRFPSASAVGAMEGVAEGGAVWGVGTGVGWCEGEAEGYSEGVAEGGGVGCAVGMLEGENVG